MSIAKVLLLYSALVCWVVQEVGAVPTPTSTVTLYTAVPLQIAGASALTAHGTGQIDVSALGIKTDSAGAETTYSIGEYVSAPRILTTVTEEGFTETLSLPGTTLTENYTLVESAGGYQASLSAFSSGSVTADGFYESCTFGANEGASASCMLIDYDYPTDSGPLMTATVQGFEASKAPLVVLPTPTSSPNAAMSIYQGSYEKRGLCVLIVCTVSILVGA